MSLHIEEHEADGVVILDLDGDLTFGEGDLAFRERLLALREAGKVKIVLNLQSVDHIDSTGLGTLVFGLARLRKAGGNLALANLNRNHLRILVLTKLAVAFELFRNAQDAVNSFFPERAVNRFDILEFVQQEEAAKHSGQPRMEESL